MTLANTNQLTIKPTVSSQIGTKVLTITQTPAIRSAFTYDHVTLTITCVITRIDPPSTPLAADLMYTVNAPSSLVINLSPAFA